MKLTKKCSKKTSCPIYPTILTNTEPIPAFWPQFILSSSKRCRGREWKNSSYRRERERRMAMAYASSSVMLTSPSPKPYCASLNKTPVLGFPVAASSSKPSVRTSRTLQIRCQDKAVVVPLDQRWMFDETEARGPVKSLSLSL